MGNLGKIGKIPKNFFSPSALCAPSVMARRFSKNSGLKAKEFKRIPGKLLHRISLKVEIWCLAIQK